MKSFQSFRVDTENQCLWRAEDRVPIPPKTYDVLRYLVENPERLVTPDELLEKLWPDTYVNPEVIRKYILEIRKILGDRAENPEFIETVRKRGYRFVAPVTDENRVEPSDSSSSREDAGTVTKQDISSAWPLPRTNLLPVSAAEGSATRSLIPRKSCTIQ